MQVYLAITPKNASSAIPKLQTCLRSVKDWMAANKLKLNPDKTEFNCSAGWSIPCLPVEILDNLLHPSSCVHKLGVVFDSGLPFSKQINANNCT